VKNLKLIIWPAIIALATAFPAHSESGQLTAKNGKTFPFTYSAQAGATTVIYVGGMGGKGNEISKLAKKFNKSGLSLITFDRAEKSCKNTQECVEKVASRVPSKTLMADANGRATAADDIMANELSAVFAFATSQPTYNKGKGIVLIGGSYGSWLSLVATQSKYKSHIKGAVFLSPAINPLWVEGARAPKENVNKFKSLARSFGKRKSITIGSNKDPLPPKGSTLDAAQLLDRSLSGNRQIIETKSKKHSSKLLLGDKSIQKAVIGWITKSF
jgi:alpha-beta hydrolase superfamily lysophospholipase